MLIGLAVSTGLDEERFRACYDDDRREDFTKDANRAARREGVRATPTFFIDGTPVQGALPAETFGELIERALEGR